MILRLLIAACLILSSAPKLTAGPANKNSFRAKSVSKNGKVVRAPQHTAKGKTQVKNGRVAKPIHHPSPAGSKKKVRP